MHLSNLTTAHIWFFLYDKLIMARISGRTMVQLHCILKCYKLHLMTAKQSNILPSRTVFISEIFSRVRFSSLDKNKNKDSCCTIKTNIICYWLSSSLFLHYDNHSSVLRFCLLGDRKGNGSNCRNTGWLNKNQKQQQQQVPLFKC